MTKEERQMELMTPKEKEFYLQFRKENPDKGTDYHKAWAKYVQDAYDKTRIIIY
jgi:hypothetical protein